MDSGLIMAFLVTFMAGGLFALTVLAVWCSLSSAKEADKRNEEWLHNQRFEQPTQAGPVQHPASDEK